MSQTARDFIMFLIIMNYYCTVNFPLKHHESVAIKYCSKMSLHVTEDYSDVACDYWFSFYVIFNGSVTQYNMYSISNDNLAWSVLL